jgi:hypothetical protein
MGEDVENDLSEAIINGINSWRKGSKRKRATAEIEKVATPQDQVGWRSMFEGRPVKGWTRLVEKLSVTEMTAQRSKRWLAALLSKFINTAWDIWQHRNGILHQQDQQKSSGILNAQVIALHGAKLQALQGKRHPAAVSLEKLMESSEQAKMDWSWVAKGAIAENQPVNRHQPNPQCKGNHLQGARRRSL